MRARALIASAVLVPVLAACGGGSSHKAKLASAQSTTTTTVPGAGAATTVPGVSGGSASATKPGTNGAPAGPGAPNAGFSVSQPRQPGQPPPHATASLNRTCVRRGIDPLILTVHTEPNQVAGYSTEYSNHTNSLTNPEYKSGGDGYGKAGPDGVYTATWVVPATAPAGDAILRVLAVSDVMPELHFKVVLQTGTCP
jgi:hypothetical protein